MKFQHFQIVLSPKSYKMVICSKGKNPIEILKNARTDGRRTKFPASRIDAGENTCPARRKKNSDAAEQIELTPTIHVDFVTNGPLARQNVDNVCVHDVTFRGMQTPAPWP